jgi:hypothetical protein
MQREKEEKEEKRKIERELAQALDKIKRERLLQQAKAQSRISQQPDVDEHLDSEVKSTAHNSTGLGMPASQAKTESKRMDLLADLPSAHAQQQNAEHTTLSLPPGNLYHFFASHKVSCFVGSLMFLILCLSAIQKTHSVHGSISEAIARAAKDWLEDVRGLCGFFDVRILTTRTLASNCMAYC